MRLGKISLMVLAAGIVLSTSCLTLDFPWTMSGGYSGEFHRIISFQPGGTVQLDNPVGDVEIRGWDEKQVEITARQEGSQGYGPEDFSFFSLRREPRVAVDSTDSLITIKTLAPGHGQPQPVVQYLVYVPRSIALKDIRVEHGSLIVGDVFGPLDLSVGEGDLTVENYSGSLKASVVKGTVEAEVLDLRAEDTETIGVDQGNITLSLEADAGAKLQADAGDGRVRSEFDLGTPTPAAKVSAVIGDGRAVISLKTAHGNIRLNKVH